MRRTVVLVGAILLLGCGGAWTEAMVDALHQEVNQMEATATQLDASEVNDLLGELRVHVQEGRVGVFEMAEFKVVFDEALADGEVTGDELAELSGKVEEMGRE